MWLWQNDRDKDDIAVQTDSLVQPRKTKARVVDYPHGVGKFHSGSNFRKVRNCYRWVGIKMLQCFEDILISRTIYNKTYRVDL